MSWCPSLLTAYALSRAPESSVVRPGAVGVLGEQDGLRDEPVDAARPTGGLLVRRLRTPARIRRMRAAAAVPSALENRVPGRSQTTTATTGAEQ